MEIQLKEVKRIIKFRYNTNIVDYILMFIRLYIKIDN